MEVKMVKIMGYGGGPGCCYGNTYKGRFGVEFLKEGLLKFTALEDGTREYRDQNVPKGESFYVAPNNIQEMY